MTDITEFPIQTRALPAADVIAVADIAADVAAVAAVADDIPNVIAAGVTATTQADIATTAADRAEIARDDAQGVLPDRLRRDVPTLLADTTLTYTAAQPGTVAAGDIIQTRAEGFSYEVAASTATDQHVTTAGGVKLHAISPFALAFGAAGDGVTNDATALNNAADAFDGFVDLGGRTYAYTGTLSQERRVKFFNGRIVAGNGDFRFNAPSLGDFAKVGGATVPSIVDNVRFNRVNANLAASTILGGTEVFPQRIGKEYHRQFFVGDGATDVFSVTAPFVINDLSPAQTIYVTGVRAADGVPLLFAVTGVTGYGTNTLTLTARLGGAAPTAGSFVEVLVFGETDDSGAVPTLVSTSGYSNAVNAIMSEAHGAHGLIENGNGHNYIGGGSYGRIGGSYSAIFAGQGNYVGQRNPSGTVGAAVVGRGNRLDGSDSFAAGLGHDVQGVSSFYVGQRHFNDGVAGVAMFGRRGQALSAFERVHSAGRATDTAFGIYQMRELALGLVTTNATTTAMADASGAATQVVPDNSAAMLRVEVSAIKDDNTKMQAFAGDFLFTRVAGVPRVNNLTSDVAITSISSIGSPGYAAFARALGTGLQIRVTGAADENVRWVASCRLTQVRNP